MNAVLISDIPLYGLALFATLVVTILLFISAMICGCCKPKAKRVHTKAQGKIAKRDKPPISATTETNHSVSSIITPGPETDETDTHTQSVAAVRSESLKRSASIRLEGAPTLALTSAAPETSIGMLTKDSNAITDGTKTISAPSLKLLSAKPMLPVVPAITSKGGTTAVERGEHSTVSIIEGKTAVTPSIGQRIGPTGKSSKTIVSAAGKVSKSVDRRRKAPFKSGLVSPVSVLPSTKSATVPTPSPPSVSVGDREKSIGSEFTTSLAATSMADTERADFSSQNSSKLTLSSSMHMK